MQNQAEYLLVLNTCPNVAVAKTLAGRIIDRKLAACVNILPNIISVYEWQGEREQSDESLLLIKTTQAQYLRLEAFIVDEHPYELPEVVAVGISSGLPDYLAWLATSK